jgi:hypothetical protein
VAAGACGLGVVVAGEEVVVAAGACGLGVAATDSEELDETGGEPLIGRGRQRLEVRFFLAIPAWAGLKRAI